MRNKDTEVNLNNLEKQITRHSFQFQRIPQKLNENADGSIAEIAKQQVNISRNNICISHSLSPPNKTYPNPTIVAKFVKQKLRYDIYGKRLQRKTISGRAPAERPKAIINESLTMQNKENFQVR